MAKKFEKKKAVDPKTYFHRWMLTTIVVALMGGALAVLTVLGKDGLGGFVNPDRMVLNLVYVAAWIFGSGLFGLVIGGVKYMQRYAVHQATQDKPARQPIKRSKIDE